MLTGLQCYWVSTAKGARWRFEECVAGMLAQLSERYDLRSAQLVGASSSALVATLSACGAGLQLTCMGFGLSNTQSIFMQHLLSLEPVSLCLCSQ